MLAHKLHNGVNAGATLLHDGLEGIALRPAVWAVHQNKTSVAILVPASVLCPGHTDERMAVRRAARSVMFDTQIRFCC